MSKKHNLPEASDLTALVRMEPQEDSGESLAAFLAGAGVSQRLIHFKVDPAARYRWFALLEAIAFEKKHAILDKFNPKEDKYFSTEAHTPDDELVRFFWKPISEEHLPEIKYEASVSLKEKREQKRAERLEKKLSKKRKRKNSSELTEEQNLPGDATD